MSDEQLQLQLNPISNAQRQSDAGNLSTSTQGIAEIKVETLQEFSFELISKSMELWRSYRDDAKAKGKKIIVANRIHKMITDAIRMHPSIKQLRELMKRQDELERAPPTGGIEVKEETKTAKEIMGEMRAKGEL